MTAAPPNSFIDRAAAFLHQTPFDEIKLLAVKGSKRSVIASFFFFPLFAKNGAILL
ncbi:hypothetical protein LG52_2147 [Geobacillus kaustophilus]|uniref:Uncharacterized protein n=1 Tax=Geobacillus kaustophilus TaxID=1462 RepID=A0A0D8BQL5_GEOKU|nr:hypothetical protein LG52_2147 [Geobacillus kaustophilus]